MDPTFLKARLAATEAEIIATETAITELTANHMLQYTLNTGQGSQTVMYTDLPRMQRILDTLYNRYSALYNRIYGSSASIARPLY